MTEDEQKPIAGEILVIGKFAKDQLITHYESRKTLFPHRLKNIIETRWLEFKSSNPEAFNGPLLKVHKYKIHKNFGRVTRIDLHLTETDYKEFVGTRDSKFVTKFGANPLSTSTVIVTRDNKLIFGKRSSDVDTSKFKISVLAGYIDPNKDIMTLANGNRQVDIFEGAIREVCEESGIQRSNIIDFTCLGLLYNTEQNQTNVPFYARLNISGKDLARFHKKMRDTEFSEFIIIENCRPSIRKFEELHYSEFSDVMSPVLELYTHLFHPSYSE
jgi:8-oxo-dGTP pyrophosphatase MutT (NUDIX family)